MVIIRQIQLIHKAGTPKIRGNEKKCWLKKVLTENFPDIYNESSLRE